jgi:hypothetical protein
LSAIHCNRGTELLNAQQNLAFFLPPAPEPDFGFRLARDDLNPGIAALVEHGFDVENLDDWIDEYGPTSFIRARITAGKSLSFANHSFFCPVAIARQMFQEILRLIAELRPQPPPALA